MALQWIYLVCTSLLLLTSVMMFEFTQTFTQVHVFPFQLLFTGPFLHSQPGMEFFLFSFPANVSTLLLCSGKAYATVSSLPK